MCFAGITKEKKKERHGHALTRLKFTKHRRQHCLLNKPNTKCGTHVKKRTQGKRRVLCRLKRPKRNCLLILSVF
jgi:hypothetical protein